jgi:hypothetical protein
LEAGSPGWNEKKFIPKSVCSPDPVSHTYTLNKVGQLTETNVAGKKAIVTTAIAFIAEASLFASSPIRTWILLSPWAATLNAYGHKLKNLLHGCRHRRTRVISFWIRALFASDRSSKPCKNRS